MRWSGWEHDELVVEVSRESFGSGWTLADDSRFWRRLHGSMGLLQLWRDGRMMTRACGRLGEHESDRVFLGHRVRLMAVCVFFSFVEEALRIVYKELPHFFARFATQIFCEILSRAELVAEEDPYFFHEYHFAEIHPYTYRSAAGTAARRVAG
jgi:hypothetical protein